MITANGITPDYGFQSTVTFNTTVVPLESGRETRNAKWKYGKHEASAQYGSLTQDKYLYLKDLFQQCRGQNYAFLFRDWADYEATDEEFGTGDGTTTTFQLSKTSSLSGGSPYTRIVRAPETGVVVKVAGVPTAASVSTSDGSVVFSSAPAGAASLTWTGKFYVVMRFKTDSLSATVLQFFGTDNKPLLSGSVDLIESFEDAV